MPGFIAPCQLTEHGDPLPAAFFVAVTMSATIPDKPAQDAPPASMAVGWNVYQSRASHDAGDPPLGQIGFNDTIPLGAQAPALLTALFSIMIAAVKAGKVPQIDPNATVVP